MVSPFIGTTNLADDFPGADAPFGMVHWSPDTPSLSEGGGYEYNDSSITGFSPTHIAGPGCGAAGDIPLLPTVDAVNTGPTDAFSHTNESATPGSYTVSLNNMAQFTFPSSTQSSLIFKPAGSQNGDFNTLSDVVSGTEASCQVTAASCSDIVVGRAP